MKDLINIIKKGRTELDFKKFLSSLSNNSQRIGVKSYSFRQRIMGASIDCLLILMYDETQTCYVYINDICFYYDDIKITNKHTIEIIKEYYKLDGYSIETR